MGSMFLNMAGGTTHSSELDDSVGRSLEEMGAEPDLDHAMHCLFQAVDIDDRHTEAYYYLGLVSAFKGYWEDACDFFDHALDCDPDHVSTLKTYARVSAIQGHCDVAHEKLHHVMAMSSGDAGLKELRLEIAFRQALGALVPLTDWFKRMAKRLNKK